jgi:hypothetical protein
VRERRNIENIINLQDFLNSVDKNIGDAKEEKEDILTKIIIYHIGIPTSAQENKVKKL